MKNWIVIIGLGLFAFAGTGYAQTCSHGSKTASANSCVKPSEAALKAASLDPSIEQKTCKGSKGICFVKKTTDAQGMVSTEPVMYDEAKAQFVSISEGNASSKTGKSCSASKACCAKGAGKACCKSKGTAAVANPTSVTPDDIAPAEQSKSK
jgi:hypothetical protein